MKPRRRGLAAGLAVGLVLAAVAVACSDGGGDDDATRTTTSTTSSTSSTSSTTTTATTSPTTSTTTTAPMPAACRSATLPLERRAALLVFATTEGDEASVRAALDMGVGGVFLPDDTAWIDGGGLAGLVEAQDHPPLVSVDEEGGRVQRLRANLGPVPAARVLSQRTPEQIRALAAEHGRKMAALGFNMDFAPVLDLVDDDRVGEKAIGDRSFSASPDVTIRAAGAFAEGLHDAGLLPTYKHFPGHGHANGDSHETLPVTPPLASLEALDLKPYHALLAAGRPRAAVMVGHLDVPDLTGGEPASLSKAAVTGLLRDQMGFDGLVITDDLGAMDAITDRFTPADAALRAIEAGVDQVLVPLPDAAAVVRGVTDAVHRGTLPEAQVTTSADRVLAAQQPDVCDQR